MKYHPRALEQVKTVLKLIKANFDGGQDFRFRVNSSYGLYVRIGLQERVDDKMRNTGFPFLVVRDL